MDDITKFLKKLNKREAEALMLVYSQFLKNYLVVPGLMKLSGYKNIYRVRVGNIRLIFEVTKKGVNILRITYRNENTYKNI